MKQSAPSSLHKALPIFMAFYVMGFGDIVGVATSYAREELGLSNALTQVLTLLAFVWFALLSVPVGVFQDKRGKKFTVNLGISFIGLGMLVPILAYTYYGMLASFTLLGIGNAIIQVSANPLMQDVSPEGRLSRNLTLSQFVKAIAGMLGPSIAAFCAIRFHSWTYVYWVYLALCILTIAWLRATYIPETGSGGRASIRSALKLLADRKVALLVTGTFLMVGFDVGMNTSIVSYLRQSFGVSQEEGSVGISIYFAALMAGRFFSVILLGRIKANRMLLCCAVLSLAAFAWLYLVPGFLAGRLALFCVGLFTAAIFPLLFSTCLRYMPRRANELSGLMIMSVCGGGVIPPVMGVINDFAGLMPSLILPGLCLVYVIFLALYIIRNKL
ncbi:MAG: MFS transporter [Tannerellaceae bacterium]|jgi:fucose permease|nr:MFS transporter [Tannerellaceae bacterium]